MKKLITFSAAILLIANVFAQSPQKMSYQSVIRNSGGTLITNQNVGVRIQILQTSQFGAAVYVETQNGTTNANGLLSLEIGSGTVVVGTFAGINWANGPYYIKIETDPLGGTNYTITGTNQLLSVPYALYSANGGAGGATGATGATGTNGTNGTNGATGATGVTGATGAGNLSGTTNYVAKFTGPSSAGISQIFDDGNNVGINTTSPGFKLNVVSGTTLLGAATWNTGNDYLGTYFNVTGGSSTDLYSAVRSKNTGTNGTNYAFHGISDGASAGSNRGMYGYAANSTLNNTGVKGVAQGFNTVTQIGTDGFSSGAGDGSTNSINIGVRGMAQDNSSFNYGVDAVANVTTAGTNIGVYGEAANATTNNFAGYFNGDVYVSGTLSKAMGSFKIDHPQDPANKYLIHSFVESPDMMNIYNGNITTDANGNATVKLPDYFEAENMEFRYQLTVMGQFAQAIIDKKITGNQFVIKTDKPNVEVSWMVTGVRNDIYAQQHRIVAEVDKTGKEKGKYLHPELYGAPTTQSIVPVIKTDKAGNSK